MISDFVKKTDQLWDETEEWRKTWKHIKPCEEWIETKRIHGRGFCKHFVEARYKKFKQRILKLFEIPETEFKGSVDK